MEWKQTYNFSTENEQKIDPFQSFQESLKGLVKEQSDDIRELFDSLIFNQDVRIVSLVSAKFKIENGSPKVIQKITEVVSLMSSLDFSGVNRFLINIVSFEGKVEYSTINELISSLRSLKNVKKLEVVQRAKEDWNLYSLLLFLLFETTESIGKFKYSIKHNYQVIEMSQQIISSTKNQVDFLISGQLDLQSISYLGGVFEDLFGLAQDYTKESESGSLSPALEKSVDKKKDYMFITRYLSEKEFIPIVIAFSNLMRIWNLDYSRISKVNFQISLLNQVKQEVIQEGSVYEKLNDIQLWNKTRFYLSLSKYRNLDPIIDLFKLVQYVYLAFTWSGQVFANYHHPQFIGRLQKESQQPSTFDNVKQIEMHAQFKEDIGQFEQITQCFPKLEECYLIASSMKNYEIDLSQHFHGIMSLANRVRKMNFVDLIERNSEKSGLIVTFNTRIKEFVFISEELPKAIEKMDKAVCLILRYRYEQDPTIYASRKEMIEGIKKIIGVRSVVELELLCDLQIPEVHQIISERNSFYKSIAAYSLLVGPEMTYDPHVILADLFDFSN